MNCYFRILVGLLLVGYFTYFGFGIAYLVDYYNISQHGSYIWEYVFISLFISIIGVINRYMYRNTNIDEYIFMNACLGTIDIILAFWGIFEIAANSQITYTSFGSYALITLFLQIASCFSTIVFNCVNALFLCHPRDRYEEI